MSRRVLARPLAAATLASALVLTPTLAVAEPGGTGNGQGAEKGKAAQAPGQQEDKPAKPVKGKSGEAGKENAPGQVKGDGPATGKGQEGTGQGSTGTQPGTQPQASTGSGDQGDQGGEDGDDGEDTTGGTDEGSGAQDGDPAGNNGTVKIAALDDLDSIPNNTPHPGCSFQVEWYGFDEGEDVVSTVTFAAQAPTADVVIGGTSPSEVFVGGDPASGAGTETGLDGRQVYDLTFDGEPHPKQGYHVKLTVSTPRSLGNDTKTKVFWVAPCEEDAATGGTTEDEAGSENAGVEGTASSTQASGVLGTQFAAPIASLTSLLTNPAVGATARGVASDTSAVPTSVDAGAEGGLSALTDSPLPLGLLVAALLASAAAVVVGRRSTDADA